MFINKEGVNGLLSPWPYNLLYCGLSEYKRSKVAKQIEQKHMAMPLQTSPHHFGETAALTSFNLF